MSPLNRRGFLARLAAIPLAVAFAGKLVSQFKPKLFTQPRGYSAIEFNGTFFRTPNGERIVTLRSVGKFLHVGTASDDYVVTVGHR